MIIEMVAAEVGEGGGAHRHPLGAILVEAVDRRLVSDMADAHALQARHVRQEGDDVGRGQPGRHLVVGGGHPQRPDRRRAVPGHAPHLAGHLDRRGLAVGPGDRDDTLGIRREKSRRQPGEQAARLGVGEVRRALDLRFRPRDHRRPRRARSPSGMKSSPLKRLALERAEHIAATTLRWSMAKPVTSESLSMPGEVAQAHRVNASRLRGRTAAPRPCWARGACRAGRRASARCG